MINKSKIKKILVISHTNIGDVIMSSPAVDILKNDFPDAKVSVVVGPKAESLMRNNPNLDKVHIYDKYQHPLKTLKWIWGLRKEKFDLIVDLRNSAMPFMIGARYKTSPFLKRVKGQHSRQQHLDRLRSVYPYGHESSKKYAIAPAQEDKDAVDKLLGRMTGAKNVVMGPSAANPEKRWLPERFAQASDALIEKYGVNIIFVGDKNDKDIVADIMKQMKHPAIDLCGKITLVQLVYVFQNSVLAIANDSSPMHLASYANVAVVGLFGYSEPSGARPWSDNSCYLRKNQDCPVCQGKEEGVPHTCMGGITVDDLLSVISIAGNEVTLKNLHE
ncbi:MAG: glycosyltransferase family 9 protein [Candidatus Omnitrophica bacterium]|nr:glycosyltransferase family 9 protein [Candidatus Omnitrophota bacterium]